MAIAPLLLVVSNAQYRLSEPDRRKLIRLQHAPFDSSFAGQLSGKGWNTVLERTRRSAEAHSLLSRYFSF